MTQSIVLTDDELHVIGKALVDAYHSNDYLTNEKEIIVDLLDTIYFDYGW